MLRVLNSYASGEFRNIRASASLKLFFILLLSVPMGPVFSQPAYQEPDPAAVQHQRQQTNRALHNAQKLLQDGSLAEHLRSTADALDRTYVPGRGLNFTLPGSLSQGYPFIDEHVGRAAAAQTPRPSFLDERIRPLVLISFGMPDNQIRGLLHEAHQLKAAVVIRGLLNDDWVSTMKKLHGLTSEGLAGVSIDPTTFTRFNVSRVPTFILPLERLAPCTPSSCAPVKHVRATGSASLSYFLNFVTRTGTPEERHKARNWLAAHKGGPS